MVGRAISCWDARSTKWEVQLKEELRANTPLPATQSITKPPDAQGNAGSLPVSMKTNGQSERHDLPASPITDGADGPDTPLSTIQKHVYIVDDESAVRQAILFALRTAGYDVRPFANGRDFLDATSILAPGCALLDLRMPELGGLAVLDELGDKRQRYPAIAITGYGDVRTAVEAMKRGARDFLEKPFTDSALLQSLEAVFATLEDEVKSDIAHRRAVELVAGLSPREYETLQGLVAGLSNKVVAFRLGISVRTVEMHRGNLMDRLGAKSLVEAMRIAVAAGVKPL